MAALERRGKTLEAYQSLGNSIKVPPNNIRVPIRAQSSEFLFVVYNGHRLAVVAVVDEQRFHAIQPVVAVFVGATAGMGHCFVHCGRHVG